MNNSDQFSANVVVAKTNGVDGTITQTATCSDATYLFLSGDTDKIAQTIKCTKETGRYDKQLMPCSQVTMYASREMTTVMDLSTFTPKVQYT